MAKKIVLVVLLLGFIIGIALFAQWYADKKCNETVLNLESQTFDLGKGVTLEMIRLPAGTFRMGSTYDPLSYLPWRRTPKPDERPAHKVELSEFWIGKYEVTQEQYESVMGNNPSGFRGVRNPVEQVLWDDAMEFCKALTIITGTSFTLPTEAQWEYACRAGSTTAFSFGNNEKDLDRYAWHTYNSGLRTHPVGKKKPNHWGLYDMHGNVWEWCRDYYDEKFYGTSAATVKNPENTTTNDYHVIRGCAMMYYHGDFGSAYRKCGLDSRNFTYGFRVVIEKQ